MGRLAGIGTVVGVVLAVVGAYGAGGQGTGELEARVATLEAAVAARSLPPPLELPVDLLGLSPWVQAGVVQVAAREDPGHVLALTCAIGGGGGTVGGGAYHLACVRPVHRPGAPAPAWLVDLGLVRPSTPPPTPTADSARTASEDAPRAALADERRPACDPREALSPDCQRRAPATATP